MLNERELVINLGRRDGVRSGMRFRVLAQETLEIHDPLTHEPLGDLDREKVRVEATEVHDRLAVCKTYEFWMVGGELRVIDTFQARMREMAGPARRVYETLRVDEETAPAPLSPEESYVKVGDRVRQIPPNDPDADDDDR